MGFRQFSIRELDKVRGARNRVCMAWKIGRASCRERVLWYV